MRLTYLKIVSLILLIVLFSGCTRKFEQFKYHIDTNTELPSISDEKLKSMSVKNFYDFTKYYEIEKDEVAYVPLATGALLKRYCELKNSEFIIPGIGKYRKTKSTYLYFKDIDHFEAALIKINRIIDFSAVRICYNKNTNEFIQFINVEGHVRHHREISNNANGITISDDARTSFLYYYEEIQREEQKKAREYALTNYAKNQKRNRTGSHRLTFFTKVNTLKEGWYKENCYKQCEIENIIDTGYDKYESALKDGWKLVSEESTIAKNLGLNCNCIGKKLIMKK